MSDQKPHDIAIIVLASWGDVVISSIISRAIKEQWPGRHVTYITTSACAGAAQNNPDIDRLEVIQGSKDHGWAVQDSVIAKARGEYKTVITPWAGWYPQHEWLPLTSPGWDGQPHHSFMWAYARSAQLAGLSIRFPLELRLHLTGAEKARAAAFLAGLDRSRRTVLMETEGHSSQSWMNEHWIPHIVDVLRERWGAFNLLISRGGPPTPVIAAAMAASPGSVRLLNDYSLREVSAIFNGCDAFIGCSSGTSNACHGHECRRDMPWFENVKSSVWDSRPLRPHGKHINYDADISHFLDMLRTNLH